MPIEVEELRRANLQPGEVVVITLAPGAPAEMVDDLSAWLQEAIPNNKVLVLVAPSALSIISPPIEESE